jgi:hypothetical protein
MAAFRTLALRTIRVFLLELLFIDIKTFLVATVILVLP